MKVMDNIAANAGPDNTVTKIGDDNVGNKMLQVGRQILLRVL